MKKNNWISILSKERKGPWFLTGSCLLVGGLVGAVIYLHDFANPPANLNTFKFDIAFRRTSSDIEAAHALSNRVEAAKLAYNQSPQTDEASRQILLTTASIKNSLNSLSGVMSSSSVAEIKRVFSLDTSAGQMEAKQSRDTLNEISNAIATLTQERLRRLSELQDQRKALINKQRWGSGLAALAAAGVIFSGVVSLRIAYQDSKRK